MEREGDERDVARLPPVDLLPSREPLVDEVPAGEQAAVHGDVGDPRVAAEHLSHDRSVMYRRNIHDKITPLPTTARTPPSRVSSSFLRQ